MIGELTSASAAWATFGLAVLIFGFAPGLALAAVVRLFLENDPRRRELQAELYAVPRWERPFWVAQQLEVALRQGLVPRCEWWFGRHLWHRAKIVSGLALHRQYPESFWVPDALAKAELRPGNTAKLVWRVRGLPGERMWVTVISRDGDHLIGTLSSWALIAYLYPDETVEFHIDDIIDCDLKDDEVPASSCDQ